MISINMEVGKRKNFIKLVFLEHVLIITGGGSSPQKEMHFYHLE